MSVSDWSPDDWTGLTMKILALAVVAPVGGLALVAGASDRVTAATAMTARAQ